MTDRERGIGAVDLRVVARATATDLIDDVDGKASLDEVINPPAKPSGW